MCAFFDLVFPLLGIYPEIISHVHKGRSIPHSIHFNIKNKIYIRMDTVVKGAIDMYRCICKITFLTEV